MFQQLLDIATRISQGLFGHCWVERRKVMVEYGRFGGKKVEKEGREGRRINIEDCYPEYLGDGGQPFLLPFSESIKRG